VTERGGTSIEGARMFLVSWGRDFTYLRGAWWHYPEDKRKNYVHRFLGDRAEGWAPEGAKKNFNIL